MHNLSNKTARAGGQQTRAGVSHPLGSVQDRLHRGPDERAEDRTELLAERRAREADDVGLRRLDG